MHTDERQILAHLDMVLKTMEDGVTRGLSVEGLLPGLFEFRRETKRIYEQSKSARGGDGFVLIPCIERNAFGALKAYNACLLAKNEIVSQHWEDLDRVIAAMLETGKALPASFKEMGTAGLGVSMVDC